MKVDPVALALRLGMALFLFSLILLVLYLIGTAQSFSEEIQARLFQGVRWLAWGGLLVSLLVLVPWARHRKRRVLAALAMGAGFALLVAFVLFWGVWIYPTMVAFPW